MGDLTDLELCKSIAEIEGVNLSENINDLTGNYETMDPPYISYNPTTNKELLFDLMVKHKVVIGYGSFNDSHCVYINDNQAEIMVEESSLPRAILTAIVEANK